MEVHGVRGRRRRRRKTRRDAMYKYNKFIYTHGDSEKEGFSLDEKYFSFLMTMFFLFSTRFLLLEKCAQQNNL